MLNTPSPRRNQLYSRAADGMAKACRRLSLLLVGCWAGRGDPKA